MHTPAPHPLTDTRTHEWLRDVSALSGLSLRLHPPVDGPSPTPSHDTWTWPYLPVPTRTPWLFPVRVNGEVAAWLEAMPGETAPSLAQCQAALHVVERLANDHWTIRDMAHNTARLWRERSFLASLGHTFSLDAGVEPVCRHILEQFRQVMRIARASILLKTPENTLRFVAGLGIADDIVTNTDIPIGQGIAGTVAAEGRPLFLERGADDPALLAALHTPRPFQDHPEFERLPKISAPAVSLPIFEDGPGSSVIGVLNVTDRDGREGFLAEDVKLLESVAAMVAHHLRAVRLVTEIKATEQLHRELEVAASIQQRLLPSAPPTIPGFTLAGACQPAEWIGGDYYDYLPLGNGHWGLCLFDVSGHGIPAALLMGTIRAMVHTLAALRPSPRELADELNHLLARDVGDSGMFATGIYLDWDPETGVVAYVNMGHNSPFVLRRAGYVDYLTTGGLPIGILDDTDYREARVVLEHGDALILYTDGITEAQSDASDAAPLGLPGIQDVIRDGLATAGAADASPVAQHLVRRLLDAAHAHQALATDDRTALILHVAEHIVPCEPMPRTRLGRFGGV